MVFLVKNRKTQVSPIKRAVIPETEMERFTRLRRKGDCSIMSDMYSIPAQNFINAFNYGKANDEVLAAMREFYGPKQGQKI